MWECRSFRRLWRNVRGKSLVPLCVSLWQTRWGLALHFWALTASLSGPSAQAKPRLQRGGSSASLHNSLMRNSIFQLMIHTLDPLAEGKHQAFAWWGGGRRCAKSSFHKIRSLFRHKPADVRVLTSARGSPGPSTCLSATAQLTIRDFSPGAGVAVRSLILSFDASSINTVCYEAEKTRAVSLPSS